MSISAAGALESGGYYKKRTDQDEVSFFELKEDRSRCDDNTWLSKNSQSWRWETEAGERKERSEI